MTKYSKRSLKNFLIAIAIATVSTSCGSTDSSFTPIGDGGGGTGAPIGTLNPNTFYHYCAQRGGVVYQVPEPYCRIDRDFRWSFSNLSFPYVTPSSPAGLNAAPPANQAFHVKPGDRLVVHATSTSGWGSVTTSQTSYLGGLFNVSSTSWKCNSIRLNGRAEGSSTVTYNEDVAAGLVGSIGGRTPFLIGHSFDRILDEEGAFRFGFNAPIQESTVGLCFQVWFERFEIRHCENMAGQTIPCP